MGEQLANDAKVARLAAHQHGVVSVGQLEAAGIGRQGRFRRVEAGRLHRLHRGVYAVGHPALSFEGRCWAAVLALGDGAVISHASAAVVWGMLRLASGPVHVTVPTSAGRARRQGITVHRSTLDEDAVTRHRGIPLTRPARTLRDLPRTSSPAAVRRATRRAVDLRLLAESDLDGDPDLTRSELERLFLALCRRRRLPPPEVNVRVGPHEVDFLWRSQSVIVETDGFEFHGNRLAFESDRARDAALQAAGFRVLRFTYRQLRDSPASVAGSLRAVIGRR